ncbi:hypothetical protein [Oceanobacillus alkalisoli]|uniref:hypothetical protein n=1 Tax=Oceanobacillus alkalisoli TaxID=2925113 RepID=UPI001F11AD74|nr:hypothetical protein [Oceanobacillus alkalisoli]MCF3943951.1 hypothetical protein [Oceanobacillus alkalisoli]
MNISKKGQKKIFALAMILMLSISFSLNSVSANNVDSKNKTSPKDEILSGDAMEKI